MTRGPQDDERLMERAAQWFGVLLEDGNTERAGFFNWMAESPRNVEAFMSVLATAAEIAGLTREQEDRIAQLAAQTEEIPLVAMGSNVVPFSPQTSEPTPSVYSAPTRQRVGWRWGVTVATGTLALVGAIFIYWMAVRPTYRTHIGEQRVLELADGSIIDLDADSKLELSFSHTARTVRLLAGRALFKVKHDASRPFVVESGNTVIEAIGTQFDVYRRADETQVAVVEGVVQVSPPAAGAKPRLLSAGDNADIGLDGKIVKHAPLQQADVTAWQQRRLVFREDTLGDIAAEFNRYNSGLQIRVVGDAAGKQHFSGTFDADAPETFIRALAGDNTLIVEPAVDGHEVVIATRTGH